jgi:hypothetical protein
MLSENMKAVEAMLVTELGIVNDVRSLQSENTPPPILVTELGMTTDVKPELENAFAPIFVTELPIVTEDKP